MSISFIHHLSHIIFIIDILPRTVHSILQETLQLILPKRYPLSLQQSLDNLLLNHTTALRVQHFKCRQEVLSRGRSKLIVLKHLEHVRLKLFVLDKVARHIVFELRINLRVLP